MARARKKADRPAGAKFAVGDIVELLSGSPPMTITAIAGNELDLVWFALGLDLSWRGPFVTCVHKKLVRRCAPSAATQPPPATSPDEAN